MKRILKTVLMSFVLIITPTVINAVASEIVTATKGGKTIIVVNDRHVDEKVNKQGPFQRAQLLNNLDVLNKQATKDEDRPFVIVEDMYNYAGNNEVIKAFAANQSLVNHEMNQQQLARTVQESSSNPDIVQTISVIGNLALDCAHLNIDCFNVECRHAKWVSRSDGSIAGLEVVSEYEQNRQSILNDIESIKRDAQNDQEAYVVHDACIKIMEINDKYAKSSIDYLRNAQTGLRQLQTERSADFMKAYKDYHDLYLIDARILLAWYKNRSRNSCVIIAGESHLENVLQVFEVMGYTIERYGNKYPMDMMGYTQTVQNCLNMDSFFTDIRKVEDNPSLFNRLAQNLQLTRDFIGSTVNGALNSIYQLFS